MHGTVNKHVKLDAVGSIHWEVCTTVCLYVTPLSELGQLK